MTNNVMWNIFLAIGTALGVAGAFITRPEDFGITAIVLNWIRLLGAVLAGVGGAFGHSIIQGRINATQNQSTNSNPPAA